MSADEYTQRGLVLAMVTQPFSVTRRRRMARLAIFVDGGYVAKLAEQEFGVWVDYHRLSEEVVSAIAERTRESLDLLRTYYYDALPYKSNPPTPDEARRFGNRRGFFDALQRLPKYRVREGWVAYRGNDFQVSPSISRSRSTCSWGWTSHYWQGRIRLHMLLSYQETATLRLRSRLPSKKASWFGLFTVRELPNAMETRPTPRNSGTRLMTAYCLTTSSWHAWLAKTVSRD